MPEHLHFRLTFPPFLENPLRKIGTFVQNIKRWSKIKLAKENFFISWQKNYHDYLCVSREINEKVDEYIRLNPLKWALMHGKNPPMSVIEPLEASLLPSHEWWTGVGNTSLLTAGRPLLALRLSRKLRIENADAILPGILRKCQAGRIPISTFLSPLEQLLFHSLCTKGIPMICAVPDPLQTIHRPRTEQTPLFARHQLLLLSHPKTFPSRQETWHSLNEDIAAIARRSGGEALYLSPT